jgi:cytochrome c-type biogenesis protein CcmF
MEKRDALKVWTILLAILAFSLSPDRHPSSVRSGVLTSVPRLLPLTRRAASSSGDLVFCSSAAALALFALRAPLLKQGGLFAPIRAKARRCSTTCFPGERLRDPYSSARSIRSRSRRLTGEKISVGAPFFNATFGRCSCRCCWPCRSAAAGLEARRPARRAQRLDRRRGDRA